MGEQSPEATLAVAVNDIDWMKDMLKETNSGVKELQRTFNEHSNTYATKAEVAELRKEVEKLKLWRKGISTAISIVTGAAILAFEYLRQWVHGGGGH